MGERSLTLAISVCSLVATNVSCGRGNAKSRPDNVVSGGASAVANQPREDGGSAADTQSCGTAPMGICYRDTARVSLTGDEPVQYPHRDWVWFAAAGDSIEIWAPSGASVATSIGQERDSLNHTARQFRHRLPRDGVLEIYVFLDGAEGDTVPYTIRILRRGSTSLTPTGRTATLSVVSRHEADQFSLVPLSLASTVRDRSEWRIVARPYKVALVNDSLYELCRLPCSSPQIVLLTPSATVIKKF
jgi:hypothetical protein